MAYAMYCKLFASLYQGTLRGASHEILVFTNMLAHAGRDGVVDKHFRAIAEETGLTIQEVKAATLNLEAPDPESRSPDEGGARIVRMDEHRVWGWRIVNYGKYRAIRSEEDRAEQNRLAQERWRNKSKPPSAKSKQDKPMQKEKQQAEEEKIYSAYPLKKARPEAIKAIKRALERITFNVLLERTQAYAKSRNGDLEFVPNPATWFNQDRFNDDPSTWKPHQPQGKKKIGPDPDELISEAAWNRKFSNS